MMINHEVKEKAMKTVNEILESGVGNIIMYTKVSTSPTLRSIREEEPEDLSDIVLEIDEDFIEEHVGYDDEPIDNKIVSEKKCCSFWGW